MLDTMPPGDVGVDSASGRQVDAQAQDEVIADFAAAADVVDLPSGSASSSAAPAPPAPAGGSGDDDAPWNELSEVSPLGYVYDKTPRSVLRVQRGKPSRSTTINCYRHPSCRLLLRESETPADIELLKWLYEVPAATNTMTREERKALAERHVAIGRARWYARG